MTASASSAGAATAAAAAAAAGAPAGDALAVLRVQILAARDLPAMDRNGLADPFVTLAFVGGALPVPARLTNAKPSEASSAAPSTAAPTTTAATATTTAGAGAAASHGSQRRATSVAPKTRNPTWPAQEATFDLPILPEWLGIDDDDEDEATAAGGVRQRKRSVRIAGKAASAAFAPIRLTARGAAAGARAVRQRTPRPMIMGGKRRRQAKADAAAAAATATTTATAIGGSDHHQLELIPSRGSIALSRRPHAVLKAGIISGVELVVWDKDKYTRNDYMGEASVPVEAWAPALAAQRLLANHSPSAANAAAASARPGSGSIAWDDAQPFWVPLHSARLNTRKKVTGELQVKVGLVAVPNASVEHERAASSSSGSPSPGAGEEAGHVELPTLADVYQALLFARLDLDNASVRAVPADQSVGTAQASEPFVDDGLSSGDESEDDLLEELESEDDDDSELDSDEDGDGSGSEESYYDTETDVEGTDREEDGARRVAPASTSTQDAAALNQANIIPPAKLPLAAVEPGPLATSPGATPPTSPPTGSELPPPSLSNLPPPPTTRPENKTRRSFTRFFTRPKSSSSASSSKGPTPGLDRGGSSGSIETNLTVPGAAAANERPAGSGRRRIRRIRKKTSDAVGGDDGVLPAGEDGATTSRPALATSPSGLRRLSFTARAKKAAEATSSLSREKREARTARRRASRRRSRAAGAGAGGADNDFSFKVEAGLDIIGIVMLEVKGARDLPRWKNMIGGFDMDPFTVISFGQKIYRTRVCRHSLNPVWDEKLLFHVRRYETNFQIKAAIYDWDRISSHDFCGGASLNVADLIAKAPKPDPHTGLYPAELDLDQELATFDLPLENVPEREGGGHSSSSSSGTSSPSVAESLLNKLHLHKHPVLTLRAKFQPYAALRQRFWRQLLKQFDTDDSSTVSFLELSAMLDSLGGTLSRDTIVGWFEGVGKDPDEAAAVDVGGGAGAGAQQQKTAELTYDEAIAALEREVRKPEREKRVAAVVDSGAGAWAGLESGPQTPALPTETGGSGGGGGAAAGSAAAAAGVLGSGGSATPPPASETDTASSGIPAPSASAATLAKKAVPVTPHVSLEPPTPIDGGLQPFSKISNATSGGSGADPVHGGHARKIEHSESSLSALSYRTNTTSTSGETVGEPEAPVRERIITLKHCPLCQMPRLSKKADGDVITHLAVCAAQDWRRVDSLMVSNFVTASQAHRKWFTKVVNKISHGSYQLGANSANVLAMDRRTGEIVEEKMPTYVRLGIRLLYQGARSRMEGARIKRMLANMSVKQGIKYNSPQSKADIPAFIAFHNLDMSEVRDPLDSFATFNEFFYRKLKPDARPIDSPEDPNVLVSAADCRLMAFDRVDTATKIWVKGRNFTIPRLLGDDFKDIADQYSEGAGFCIFRLAPQDYHRFHCPADAVVGRISKIEGQYYTVNPMAIRSAIDVYGENVREVVEFHSPQLGTFVCVLVGAMLVGSIGLEIKTGQHVKRGDPFGWFAFGGSTICMVLPPGACEFDQDLLDNSDQALETLVRVGMRLGRATGKAQPQAQDPGQEA